MVTIAPKAHSCNDFTANLPQKYRPRTLGDVRGQAAAVKVLKRFATAANAGNTTPAAFLFHGASGVGKTAAAWALAGDLGVDIDDQWFGGVSEIPSGEQDGTAVRELFKSFRFRPMSGSGWRVAIVNEADFMTQQAEAMWLDCLEHLPAKTVIIFTTNNPARLAGRLVTRCQEIEFESDPKKLRRSLVEMARDVWHRETGKTLGDVPENFGVMNSLFPTVSYRLALQQLSGYIAAGSVPAAAKSCTTRESAATDGSSAAKKAWETRRRKAAVA